MFFLKKPSLVIIIKSSVTLLLNKAPVTYVITNMKSKVYKLVGFVCSFLISGEMNYISFYMLFKSAYLHASEKCSIKICFINILVLHELFVNDSFMSRI